MKKSIDDLKAAVEILDTNIAAFLNGTNSCYRVVATQLRLLMCDRDSLIERLFPNATLHAIDSILSRMPHLAKGMLFQLPVHIEFREGKIKSLSLNVDPNRILTIKGWVDQPLLNEEITVKALIRSVADKEGVHSDRSYNDTLILSKSIKILNEESQSRLIVAIGIYVLNVLKQVLYK